ncbi:unnamed protein product [Acanthocheilonema viteae]|uniref:Uncharacterized protein n=1 Tax=Acanthocheilonema viteae TaxID=6277 RepID=A0A498SS76_ACAVI|nr:unnamed protein product [Acanthocheilonema viteae]
MTVFGWLIVWLARLFGWPGCLVGPVVWLGGWLFGCLISWLVARLVGWLADDDDDYDDDDDDHGVGTG